MCFIHRESSRYSADVKQCVVICMVQEHDGIVSFVTIAYIVVSQNINYTFMPILQSDNAMVSCVGDLLAPSFPHENEKKISRNRV